MFVKLLVLIFSLNAVFAASLMITSRNTIHSILFLVLVFFNASGLLLLLQVEFLSLIILVIYVGAIAILFLFVVMLLNINTVEYSENLIRYLPIGALLCVLFFFEIYLAFSVDFVSCDTADSLSYVNWVDYVSPVSQLESIGQVLYTNYFYLFLLSSVILLVAMIAAIVLTMEHDASVRRQDILKQVSTKTSHIYNVNINP